MAQPAPGKSARDRKAIDGRLPADFVEQARAAKRAEALDRVQESPVLERRAQERRARHARCVTPMATPPRTAGVIQTKTLNTPRWKT